MTKHDNDQERERLQTKISSQNLLTRLHRNHGSQSITTEKFIPLRAQVKARLGFTHLQIHGREFTRLRISGRNLLQLVADFYELKLDDLRGSRRTNRHTRARMAFYFHAAKCLQLTNAQIARLMCRDQSTIYKVLYSFAHGTTQLTKDKRFEDEIELIWLKASEQYGLVDEVAE